MWNLKASFWCKITVLLLVVALLVPVLIACGDDDNEDKSTQQPTTTTQQATTTTSQTTASAVSQQPVKFGAITSWSGSMAMAGLALADPVIELVEHQVKEMGGILGGRELKVIKCDNAGSVAQASACAKKLILDDKVSVLVFGGLWGSEIQAVSDVAEKEGMLFATFGDIEGMLDKQFTVNCAIQREEWGKSFLAVASKILHAKTVAFLANDTSDSHLRVEGYVSGFEDAGIKVVYKEYVPQGTIDFSPYVTKIKYKAPDVVVTELTPEDYLALGKQVQGLGGWGGIGQIHMTQALSAAAKLPSFEGAYISTAWVPGLKYPGAKKFERDYQTLRGSMPTGNHVYFYLSLWTAINAVEMAGGDKDRAAIAKACRSGNLEWESPGGPCGIGTDGFSTLKLTVVHVENGKFVPVDLEY